MMTKQDQVRLKNIADTDYEIYALLKQRYSPRTFKNQKIKREQLMKLFEAARWSASSFNIQPWRFVYAEKGTEAFENIVDCLSEDNKEWAPKAPVLMLSIYKEKMKEGIDNYHARHDLGLCLGGMTVQAQYMGIALHHMAGFDREKSEKVFDIPEGFHVNAAIALGYYGGELDKLPMELQEKEIAQRNRMPQEEFAFANNWKS